MKLRGLLLFFCFSRFCSLHAMHDCEEYRREIRLVNVPVAGIYVKPDTNTTYDSQKVYGNAVRVVEHVGNGWLKVAPTDSMQGYMQEDELAPDNLIWRASAVRMRVKNLEGHVYLLPNMENQALVRLSHNAYVNAVGASGAARTDWQEVELIDGSHGYMMAGDLEQPRVLSAQEVVERSKLFLGRPYIWGGASSFGFDCSAFVQTLARQMGYPMLRDSRPQAADPGLQKVAYENIQPGDFLYFGQERVNHVALCVGPDEIIHATIADGNSRLKITDIVRPDLNFLCARRVPPIEYRAQISEIDDALFQKMQAGHSWRDNNPVPREDLRHIAMRYWGFDNCMHEGEMIVHAEVAQEVADIFSDLFEIRFPIERMQLMHTYDGCDPCACADNNTSAFCSRPITGGRHSWSLHSLGLAIDINTRLNPYHKGDHIEPANGEPFLNRDLPVRGLIRKGDACYRAFASRGWQWGGDWRESRGYVDHQHFYKDAGLFAALIALVRAQQ